MGGNARVPGGRGGRDEEQLSEDDGGVPTPKARVQFVREALGLQADVVDRDVAREARRMLRDVRPRMNTASISEILRQAEQHFRRKKEQEGDLLTPSPLVQRKNPRVGRRAPRGLPEVYPVGDEPQPSDSAATYPQSQVNVYTAGGAGSSSSHGHQGGGGGSLVDTMEALLLMQQADLDARSAHRTALLLRAAQRKH